MCFRRKLLEGQPTVTAQEKSAAGIVGGNEPSKPSARVLRSEVSLAEGPNGMKGAVNF